jgi:hypothetical protein
MVRKLYISLSVILGIAALVALMFFLDPGQVSAADPLLQTSYMNTQPSSSIDVNMVISDALAYIHTQQKPDGGIASFGPDSDPDSTARAVLAVAAAGRSISWMSTMTGTTMIYYLRDNAISYTHDLTGELFPSRAGLLMAAASAANENPTSFGGMDLITELEGSYQPATGAYSTTAKQGWTSGAASDLTQAWAVFGLSSAGRQIPVTATTFLVDSQGVNGSWGFGDPDTTALAVVALIGSGHVEPTAQVIQVAHEYFQDIQLPNGGWRPVWDTDPLNADTTGWIMQALVVAGYDPPTESWANIDGNPFSALVSLQKPDGGIGGTYVNAYSTADAIIGLTGQPLFFQGDEIRAWRALSWMNEFQNPDGSWSSLFGHPAGATADTVLAYLSAGYDPYSVVASGSITSAMDYLAEHAWDYVAGENSGPDTAGKLALTVQAAGEDAHDFAGVDIVHVLTSTHYSPTLGAFGILTNTWHQALGMLGLVSAGENVPISATQTLLGLQQMDGGWKYDLGAWSFNSEPDSTGLAMQALLSVGISPSHTSIISATLFLHSSQDESGGWDNSNSTAYAIQGLLAAGEDLHADAWLVNGHSPYNALEAYQKVDGPFIFDFDSPWVLPVDDFYATRQALPALLGVYYPFSTTNLMIFSPTDRGPDPDRTLAIEARPEWGGSVNVVIPYGSDLDQDGDLTLDWRVEGSSEWVTGTIAHRANGYYTATLPITLPVVHEMRATFSDPDVVQFGETLTGSVSLISTLEPFFVYLPTVNR